MDAHISCPCQARISQRHGSAEHTSKQLPSSGCGLPWSALPLFRAPWMIHSFFHRQNAGDSFDTDKDILGVLYLPSRGGGAGVHRDSITLRIYGPSITSINRHKIKSKRRQNNFFPIPLNERPFFVDCLTCDRQKNASATLLGNDASIDRNKSTWGASENAVPSETSHRAGKTNLLLEIV